MNKTFFMEMIELELARCSRMPMPKLVREVAERIEGALDAAVWLGALSSDERMKQIAKIEDVRMLRLAQLGE